MAAPATRSAIVRVRLRRGLQDRRMREGRQPVGRPRLVIERQELRAQRPMRVAAHCCAAGLWGMDISRQGNEHHLRLRLVGGRDGQPLADAQLVRVSKPIGAREGVHRHAKAQGDRTQRIAGLDDIRPSRRLCSRRRQLQHLANAQHIRIGQPVERLKRRR